MPSRFYEHYPKDETGGYMWAKIYPSPQMSKCFCIGTLRKKESKIMSIWKKPLGRQKRFLPGGTIPRCQPIRPWTSFPEIASRRRRDRRRRWRTGEKSGKVFPETIFDKNDNFSNG